MKPWDNWYHCMSNTYGTWLPGDPRGFRTYHHKRHIPYDYKHRPPDGFYDALYKRSKRLMKREPVILRSVEQRQRVLEELVASLLRRNIPVAVACVDRIHLHVLARLVDRDPRHWMGIAKRESSYHCKATGHAPAGGIWSVNCDCRPIADEHHFARALGYIADHASRGAEVYRGVIPSTNPLADFDPSDLLVG